MSARDRFLMSLAQVAPDLNRTECERLVSPELITDCVLELPQGILRQAREIVTAFFSLRKDPAYLEALELERQTLGVPDPGNDSIAMSYDFHLNTSGDLKLVEINTNASFLALSPVLYQALELPPPVKDFTHDEIRANIENEMRLSGIPFSKNVSIVDEDPPTQKLFVEFLLYQSLMKRWGWNCKIEDVAEVSSSSTFIYNRSTDFYLQNEKSKKLREIFRSKTACVSPNPHEYLCLADKKRLVDLSRRPDLPTVLQRTLLKSIELTAETNTEIWSQRKKFFLKPLRAYGGKQSYRGENISHRLFDELTGKGIIAQEYCPPPETEHQGQKFKYDLRFFAYQDRVQCAIARLYQGQLTNLKTLGGGFGAIRFI